MATNRRDGRKAPPTLWPAVAAAALVLAVPVATWWVVGDLSEPGLKGTMDAYYFMQAPDIRPMMERTVGAVAVVLVVASAAALVRASLTGRLDGRWWSVLIPLSLAGALCGAGWRVLTAAVGGANIGAGLVIMFGGPLVLLLVGWAPARGTWLITRRRARPRG